jgi:long-chain acyl-CoA synthetase
LRCDQLGAAARKSNLTEIAAASRQRIHQGKRQSLSVNHAGRRGYTFDSKKAGFGRNRARDQNEDFNMLFEEYLTEPFGTLSKLISIHAKAQGQHLALVSGNQSMSYAELDRRATLVAAMLMSQGVSQGDAVAICATASINYALVFVGILRAGAVVAPLAPSSTADSLNSMLKDCDAKLFFLDQGVAQTLSVLSASHPAARIALDDSNAGEPFDAWLQGNSEGFKEPTVGPDDAFNIIYSSGTTGVPKGIVQPNIFRWVQFRRAVYTPDAVTIVSTPLYSNTTLVSFLPTIANGGTVVLMGKFDALEFLRLSEKHRATHAMLVPVQYRRLMQSPDFDRFDLSSYRLKFSTSAPFASEIKQQVLTRWPGGLVEYYGMTEGGGSCMLVAHENPDKLATVGQPMEGHEIRLIDEAGLEVAAGEIGEVVGRSPAMMRGYHNQPAKTREAEWYSPEGERYIRTGDVGRFDAEGFLTLMDRKKDMIISGGFNIYPSDLEAELTRHPAVLEAAVLGMPSEAWGETPVAFVVLRSGQAIESEPLRSWVNQRVGKTQRLTALHLTDALPRSAIGKVLKRELRDSLRAASQH